MPVTESSIFSVDAASISNTSETGKKMKVSPILYLDGVNDKRTSRQLNVEQLTGSCRPRQQAPARWTTLPNLLCLSIGKLSARTLVL